MLRRIPILLIVGALALAGCTTPDQPGGESGQQGQGSGIDIIKEGTFYLSFEEAMPTGQTLDYSTKAGDLEYRHTVAFYRYDEKGELSASPAETKTISSNNLMGVSFTIKLPQGRYKVLAWTDCLEGQHQYWNLSTFPIIRLDGRDDYVGNRKGREAFFGTVELFVYTSGLSVGTIKMSRPMAAYYFYATDAGAFAGRSISAQVFIGAVPSGINLQDGSVQSGASITYTVPVQTMDDGTVLLAFDYVYVKDAEASHDVKLTLLDENKVELCKKELTVPLKRGQKTVYRGAVLSAEGNAGINVDPTFDGEFEFSF